MAWSAGAVVLCIAAGAAATTTMWLRPAEVAPPPPLPVDVAPALPVVEAAFRAPLTVDLPEPDVPASGVLAELSRSVPVTTFEAVTLFGPADQAASGFVLRQVSLSPTAPVRIGVSDGPAAPTAAVGDIIRRETAGRDASLSRLTVLPPRRPVFNEVPLAGAAIEEVSTSTASASVSELSAPQVPTWPWSLPVAAQPQDGIGGRPLQSGMASWYGPGFHGRKTASGERFNQNDLTAAHRNLPFGTRVRVVDQATGRSIVVRINDRGPFAHGRVIDLSKASAEALGVRGLARVKLVSAE